MSFYQSHKKSVLTAVTVCGILLTIIYLMLLFQPGYWYDGAFLSRQSDGSFAGSNEYTVYQVQISRTNNHATVTFTANDLTKEYKINGTNTPYNISISENGTRIFHGQVLTSGDEYMLIDDDGAVDIQFGSFVESFNPDQVTPPVEELFPSATWLYNCAMATRTAFRGEPLFLIVIVICIIALVIDIKYPDFFFTLRYRHYVDGGEPSAWYRDSQKFGRVVLAIVIVFCMIRSLYPL